MTAEEFLRKARKIGLLIQSTQEVIDSLLSPKCTLNTSGTGHCSTRENNTESKYIKCSEEVEKVEAYKKELYAYRHALVKIITSPDVSNTTKLIVEQRYLLCKQWKEIAALMDYEENYTRTTLDNRAITELNKKSYLWHFLE